MCKFQYEMFNTATNLENISIYNSLTKFIEIYIRLAYASTEPIWIIVSSDALLNSSPLI